MQSDRSQRTDRCPGDGEPCYVDIDPEEAHWRCGTVQCPHRPSQTTLPARPGEPLISRDIVRQIALDIGKEVAAHIETMHPKAVEATTPNMLLSVRNCVFNQIMAALDVIDEEEIRARLESRRKFRRKMKAAYRNIREPANAE